MAQKNHCKDHHKAQPKWHCKQCNNDFCADCVNNSSLVDPPECSICGTSLYEASSHKEITSTSTSVLIDCLPHSVQTTFSMPGLILIVGLITCIYFLPFDPIIGWLLAVIILTIGIL